MDYEAYLTITTVILVLGALVGTRLASDVILMAALCFLIISGILTPAEALYGFANPGVMTMSKGSVTGKWSWRDVPNAEL